MTKRKSNLDPWEKQDGETSKAYAAFCAYRDLGIDRSFSKIIPILYPDLGTTKPSSKQRRLSEWSVKYTWVARVEAYDTYLEEKTRRANEAAIVKMERDHALIAALATHKAAERLQLIVSKLDADGKLLESGITVKEATDLLRAGVEIERKSRGAPDQKIEHGGTVIQIIDDIPRGKKDASATQKPDNE